MMYNIDGHVEPCPVVFQRKSRGHAYIVRCLFVVSGLIGVLHRRQKKKKKILCQIEEMILVR